MSCCARQYRHQSPRKSPWQPYGNITQRPAQAQRGRPKKGDMCAPKPPTQLEIQQTQSVAQMLAALPKHCNVGSKLDSKGHKKSWCGYKLHIDTADGDIPVNAILTSASAHDSQVALLLMKSTSQRITTNSFSSSVYRWPKRKGRFEHNPTPPKKTNAPK